MPYPSSYRPLPIRLSRLLGGCLAALALALAAAPRLPAIDIASAVFDAANSPARPTADPDGAKLVAHANEAAARWETAILDTHSIGLTVRYDTSAPTKGRLEVLGVSGGRATNVRIRIHPNQDWYFDGTPSSDGEFFPAPAFAFEENPADALYPFTGTPPGRLEMSYSGVTIGGNASKPDLLTVLIHHLGRALGFSDTFSAARTEIDGDGDVDIPSGWVAGQTMGVKNDAGANPDDYSLAVVNSALNYLAVASPGRRCVPSTLDYLTVAKCGGWTALRLPRMEFLRTGSQSYGVGQNWPGGLLPASTADVFIRQTAATTVTGGGFTVANLEVGGSSTLELTTGATDVEGEITVQHNGNAFQIPALRVKPVATLTADATNVIGGIVEIEGTLRSGSVFASPAATTGRRGEIRLIAGDLFCNDLSNSGVLRASGGNSTIQKNVPASPFNANLDGNGAESSTDVIVEAGSFLRVLGASYTDGFDGRLELGGLFRIDTPFTLGTAGRLGMGTGEFQGEGANPRITVNGTVDFTDLAMDITVPATFTASARFKSGSTGQLYLRDDATFSQGITIEGDGTVTAASSALAEKTATLAGQNLAGLRLSAGLNTALEIGDALTGPGHAAAIRFLKSDHATAVDIGGIATGEFDSVTVSDSALLGGALRVRFSGFAPQPGQSWRLVSGPTTGEFTSIEVTGADPAEFEVRYDAGGATLRMKSDPTLAEWLADRGVPADQRGNDDDPDHDGIENCLEALFALDPMSPDRPDIVPGTAWVDGKRYGTVTLTTNEQTIAGIRLLLQASADLQAWDLGTVLISDQPPINGTVRRTYRCETPADELPACFFRARCAEVIDRPVNPL